MGPDLNPVKEKKPFMLNKTVITDFGFNLSSDEKLYEELACPFQQDANKAHPLCAKFPEGFLAVDFTYDKVAQKFTDQTLIYIFYNVMEQRTQLQAARSLMKKNLKYHKSEKVWVRKVQSRFQYFNITEWQYVNYYGPIQNDNFYTEIDFADK